MANASVESRYAEGQLWRIRARPGEDEATLLINRIEHDPRCGAIHHIGVFGVRLDNPLSPSGLTTELPHFPVSCATLDASCVELLGVRAPDPEYRRGYDVWREAFDAGQAGVFDAPVADIVAFVQDAIIQRMSQ